MCVTLKMCLHVVSLWCLIWMVDSAVLDPSLYLSPRPPLTDTSDSISPAELWSAHEAVIQPMVVPNTASSTSKQVEEKTSKPMVQPIKTAKLFWPTTAIVRQPNYNVGAGNIQIPLTFSLSGLYGKFAPTAVGTSVIGSTYGTVSEVAGTAVSTLAGSGYGSYRTRPSLRIYGGENGPAWTGWGNGKWGHYGKG